MKRFLRLSFPILALAALLAMPTLVLAQAADSAATASGITLGPIVAIGAAVVAALGAVLNFLPSGWRTYVNAGLGLLTAIVATLTDLSREHPTATLGAIAVAFVGAIIGRAKADPKR